MTPTLIANVDPQTWERNPFVAAATPLQSVISRGAYHRLLKLPITQDRRICLARHQLYSLGKYAAELAPGPFLDWLDAETNDGGLDDGVFFPGAASHWHFLVDGLGVFRPVEGAPPRLFVDHEITDAQIAFMLQFAKACGFERFESVARLRGAAYRLRNGVFFCRQRFTHKVAWVRSVFGLAAPGATPGRRRIFVLRNNASQRRLLNQDRIAAAVRERFGFEVLDPSSLSLWEQARAFRDAEVVMGSHGAGLANMLFAEKPAMLVELYHSKEQLFYQSLCYALDAFHLTIQGERVSEQGRRRDNADYVVDEVAVLRALEKNLHTRRGFVPRFGAQPHLEED